MLLIDLIPKMVSIFNEFMSEYAKKSKDGRPYTPEEMMKLHIEMTNVYAIKAIKLAMQHINDEKLEIDWNDWLKKHGGGK